MTPLTHNGKFTVRSTETGVHRTFQIKTTRIGRILSLLTGPDNTQDYKGFAFVKDDGIFVWQKQKTTLNLSYAKMLMNLAQLQADGKCEVFAETTCRICNRTLTTPESVLSGIGPICEERT